MIEAYITVYMYNYVRPDEVLNALQWLKLNNPMYSDIDVNKDWINHDSIINSEYVKASEDTNDNNTISSEMTNIVENCNQVD